MLLLDLLNLNGRELRDFLEVFTINKIHIVDSPVMVSDHYLGKFKVCQRLIQIFLELVNLVLVFLLGNFLLGKFSLASL